MGETTGIEWCDRTFNPWIGCQRVSPGCVNCYAESFAKRFNKAEWGPTASRVRTSPKYWKQPLKWNQEEWEECRDCGWRGKKQDARLLTHPPKRACFHCDSPNLKPTRQRVFCASMADVFEDNEQLVEWRKDLFDLIEATPSLDWLILTKRPENVVQLVPQEWTEFPRNIWLGTSVENRKTFDDRLPFLEGLGRLYSVPVIWLSVEPLLESLNGEDLENWLVTESYGEDGAVRGVDWIVVGGESGAKCRPFDVEWARVIRDRCLDNDVPFFMKQLGGHPDKRDRLEDLPEDLRIREWPA